MNRAWSIIWKAALALVAFGVVMVIVGWAMGGWRPPSIGNLGNLAGGSSAERVNKVPDIHIDEQALAAFSTIDVSTETMNVTVVAGDHFGLKVDATNTPRTVTWSDQSGTLQLKQQSVAFNLSWTGEKADATITVPTGTKVSNAGLTTATGSLTISVDCDSLSAQTATGAINMSGAVANTLDARTNTGAIVLSGAAGSIQANSSTGAVTISGDSPTIAVTSTTGSVDVTGQSAKVTVSSTTGAVSVTQSTPWASTMYSLTTTIGGITTQGAGAPSVPSGLNKSVRGGSSSGATLTLNIDTTTGAISATLGG